VSVSDITRPRNGVDVPALFATLDAVRQQPGIARFQFRSAHRWISGTHNAGTISGFYGAGQEHTHRTPTVVEADSGVLVPIKVRHRLRNMGALGAKLTGAGGDGGAVIGLFNDTGPVVHELTRLGIRCFDSQLAGPREGARGAA